MNELTRVNEARIEKIKSFAEQENNRHAELKLPQVTDYALFALEARITDALSDKWGQGKLNPQFELIDRAKFGGDIAVKIPQLLRDGGPKGFIEKHLPWIVEILSGPDFNDAIKNIETKGMYINLTLSNRWLLDSAQNVVDLGADFGKSNGLADRRFVVDYSSPNVAKVLHAGHIRSTIIGHVLSNLYEANGAVTFRVNHINDFGGFGFTLEGYRRFKDQFPAELDDAARLVEIYRIRRTAEKMTAADAGADADLVADFDADSQEVLGRYFGNVSTRGELRAAFAEFTQKSDARFEALENGAAEEVELWEQMVNWSLQDFEKFYDALNINFDLIMGESLYYATGDQVVEDGLKAGHTVNFTQELADKAQAKLQAKLDAEKMSEAEFETQTKAVNKDIGAAVVPLDKGERYVVRRADGRSIYSTRDLGAIKLREELFNASDLIYVVGQEQQVHFDRLYRAAYATGLADKDKVSFQHLWFGFYVDAATGKKLSSRDTVANVNHLLEQSRQHFRSRLSDRVTADSNTVDEAAKELAIGSLVFNDLKQDIKGSVEIDVSDMAATIAGFEKAGGAYVVYAACRARSILRKYGKTPTPAQDITDFDLDDQEVSLLVKLQQLPQKVLQAAKQTNPSVLVRHLTDIAMTYNSYYMRAPVLVDGEANLARLLITQSVTNALTRGLALCHISCPEAI